MNVRTLPECLKPVSTGRCIVHAQRCSFRTSAALSPRALQRQSDCFESRTQRVRSVQPISRPFSTSRTCLKKGAKAARESSPPWSSTSGSTSKTDDAGDPLDFSALEADISKSLERLRTDLSKLRAGGRFNPETLEALRVQPSKASNETVRLADVAQIIPKGRTIQVLVGDQEHVKPTSSAIQSSDMNMTPQPDPTGTNPLLLILTIPPPTADSRKAALSQASKAGETAGTSIRNARQTQQKKLRALQLAKSARPDDLKKAGAQMEKVVEKGTAEVKRIVDGARKVLDT